jgi:hypothetical protein
MRTQIKWLMNANEIEENKVLRNNILFHNAQNPWGKLEVPDRVEPIYELTPYSFRVANVIDYIIEPTPEKDLIVNLSGRGEKRFEWEPNLINKLELLFNGE